MPVRGRDLFAAARDRLRSKADEYRELSDASRGGIAIARQHADEARARLDTRPLGSVDTLERAPQPATLGDAMIVALSGLRRAPLRDVMRLCGLDPNRDNDFGWARDVVRNLRRLEIVKRERDDNPLSPWVYSLTPSGVELAMLMVPSGEMPGAGDARAA